MPSPPSADPAPGGSRELLGLAWPLILSNGVVTAQLTIDRMMLSWHGRDDVAAAFQTAMLFWLPFGLLQATAAYTATFVAQYTGAGRPVAVDAGDRRSRGQGRGVRGQGKPACPVTLG